MGLFVPIWDEFEGGGEGALPAVHNCSLQAHNTGKKPNSKLPVRKLHRTMYTGKKPKSKLPVSTEQNPSTANLHPTKNFPGNFSKSKLPVLIVQISPISAQNSQNVYNAIRLKFRRDVASFSAFWLSN